MSFFRNIKEIIVNFAGRNFAFITTILLMSLTVFTIFDSFGKAIHLFLYTTFVTTCLAFFTDFVRPKKLRYAIRRMLIILGAIVLITDLFFAFYYQGLPDQAIIEVLLATNKDEVWEYAKANLTSGWLYAAVVFIFLVLYIASQQLIKLKRNSKFTSFFAFWLVFAAIFTVVNIVKDVCKKKDKTIVSLTSKCCPLVRTCSHIYNGINNLQNFELMLKSGNAKPRLLSNNSSIPYVVYIVGESTSRHHMGIYGYRLDNTPYMSKREKDGEVFKFTDVISPNGQTMLVLEKLFTFYRQHGKGKWYEYTDLFSILKAAGYYTTWLSNQEYSGIWGNNGRIYAERCNARSFTKLRSSESFSIKDPYDAALLPLLDRTLVQPKAKNFIVLHLLGTHQEYSDRYPNTFKAYSINDEQGENEKMKMERADYDTSIRYNDSIMNAIIKRFENKDAIIIYTSDHGEDVMEINKKVAGHGDICINNRIVEIPMMVYVSKSFREKRPELTKRIQQAVNRPYMTDDMIHSILDVMEIKTCEYNPQLSIFNDKFNANRKRYCGKKLYKRK